MFDPILLRLSAALDMAVLEPRGQGDFRALCDLPPWWQRLDPDLAAGQGCFRPQDDLPFLLEFLVDAEKFWDAPAVGWLSSGIWQETFTDRSSLYLEASVTSLDERKILVIKHAGAAADDRFALIQKGRENKLAYQRDLARREQLATELRRAKQAAEALSKAKSEFLAKMSHELRTPMNGVIGMTELLLDSHPTHEQRGYLEAVRDSAQALLSIINDILDFSKAEAGKLRLAEVDFSLRDTVADTLRLLAVSARQRGLAVSYAVSADVPDTLVGDPLRLRQIMVNLVGNAIKFTETGEVCLKVQREPRCSEPGQLGFTVRDTGVGIPQQELDMIFDDFVQVDSSPQSRHHQGTGLGLSITSQLVELMAGRIWVANTSDRGTTFCFTARFAVGEPCPDQAAPGALQRTRVLVVDGNRNSRHGLQELLLYWGIEPTCASGYSDGESALRQAESDDLPFDVCLLDMDLEDEALALSAAMKERCPACRIVQLSHSTIVPKSSSQQPHTAPALFEPVKPAELRQVLLSAAGVCDSSTAEKLSSQECERDDMRRATGAIRILVADDNPINQSVATRMLEKRGYAVVAVTNGREALDILDHEHMDAVLMDCQMPVMDGFDAARAIRARDRQTDQRTPIIAVTAQATPEVRQLCRAADMDAYVTKPFELDQLDRLIQELIGPTVT